MTIFGSGEKSGYLRQLPFHFLPKYFQSQLTIL
jgi:hypothetical protein